MRMYRDTLLTFLRVPVLESFAEIISTKRKQTLLTHQEDAFVDAIG